MTISEQVKEAMNQAGLNQPELAQKTGMIQTNISKLLRQDSATTKVLQRIANATGYTFKIEPEKKD